MHGSVQLPPVYCTALVLLSPVYPLGSKQKMGAIHLKLPYIRTSIHHEGLHGPFFNPQFIIIQLHFWHYSSSHSISVSIFKKYECCLINGKALIWLLVRDNESACNKSVKGGLICL